jgi:hypothetical protein
MRDFFINAFDKLVSIIVILGAIGIVIGAIVAMSQNGIFAALGILVGGSLYLILIGGGMYLGLGIYHNTRRMADAIERTIPR